MSEPCPAIEQLAAALRGGQPASAEAEMAAHLSECPACRARLDALAGGSGWLEARARAQTARTPPASESLRQAIQALESRAATSEPDVPSPVNLNFLQLTDQPGVLGRFGPYEVLAHVASGGMGIVLMARDPALNRIVALKILPPALAANALARARFIREARAAAAVVHDHVVPIYAVDEFGGLPYLVMQFIVGRPLSERIRASGPLCLEEILRIGAQTAAGLAAAHAQGLIHRDVKPGNILLENSVERVKITDFGLARATDDSSLTREGYIAGTPEYMSPEQARNEPVDQRADLFSLGCVLYEMATGVSPFRAEKPLVAMRRVCDEEPQPADKLNPKIPEWLGQMIQRLMAKHAAARPQTAAEVAAELKRWLAELQQAVGPRRVLPKPDSVPATTSRTLLWPAWAAVLALLLAVAWFAFLKPEPESAVGDKPVEPPAIHSNALFVIPASSDTPERGFATLADAVQAATSGGVIEFRFNGRRTVEMIQRNEKALILRAAPGFEPVLMPAILGEPVLLTHAPLVLEGLTLVSQPPRDAGRAARTRITALSVEDAAFLAAHCRFEVAYDENQSEPRQGSVLRLQNVPLARVLNCKFSSRTAYGLHWNRLPTSGTGLVGNQLVVQGSIVEGNFMSYTDRVIEALSLELRQNTFAVDTLFLRIGSDRDLPLPIRASHNVFAMGLLLRRGGRDPVESTLPRLLRWSGGSNAYSVASYTQTVPPINRHEDWLASGAVTETNSVSAELGIKARLTKLTERTPAAETAAFTLTPEERQRLKTLGWAHADPPGADPQKTGPGKPYHEWRNSPAYAEWLKLVREHVPQSAAKP